MNTPHGRDISHSWYLALFLFLHSILLLPLAQSPILGTLVVQAFGSASMAHKREAFMGYRTDPFMGSSGDP